MENSKDWHNFFGSLLEFKELIPYFENESLKIMFDECLKLGINMLD